MSRPDPIFAAIARWRTASEAHLFALRRASLKWPHDRARAEEVANRAAWPARERALRGVYGTAPTTLAGLGALAEVFHAEEFAVLDGDEAALGLLNILRSIAQLTAANPAGEEDGEVVAWLRRRMVSAAAW